MQRFRFGTGTLVAAALLVAVLGGTALAGLFRSEESHHHRPERRLPWSPCGGPMSDHPRSSRCQGVPGSPEFKANAEWMDFLASYDTAAMVKETAACLPEKYDLYSVSTQDMANELDQITRKYNLRLHTSVTDFDSEDTLYSLLNAEPFLNCRRRGRYIIRDSSFEAYSTNTFPAELRISETTARYVKGAFSEVTLNIGNAEDYEEWIYTTSRGDEVQLSLGPSRCVVMSDQPKAFVAINLLGGTEGNSFFMPEPVTKEDLEAFAGSLILRSSDNANDTSAPRESSLRGAFRIRAPRLFVSGRAYGSRTEPICGFRPGRIFRVIAEKVYVAAR